nr:MAG TPA: hypothetical protein [Caudoviricetes sp.]
MIHVKYTKLKRSIVVHYQWFTILINYFRCVLRIILPITKPIFKLFSSYLSV